MTPDEIRDAGFDYAKTAKDALDHATQPEVLDNPPAAHISRQWSQGCALVSIAFSLDRIADGLERIIEQNRGKY